TLASLLDEAVVSNDIEGFTCDDVDADAQTVASVTSADGILLENTDDASWVAYENGTGLDEGVGIESLPLENGAAYQLAYVDATITDEADSAAAWDEFYASNPVVLATYADDETSEEESEATEDETSGFTDPIKSLVLTTISKIATSYT
ncbi:MAG: hypothetical protein LUB61_01935, partial [Eggerthellaceae bacterium]|nr:hypothetical protein [Eggerthellaceae bacterium]